MIFFVTADGTITRSKPEAVYQGSSNAVTIRLVAPSFPDAQVMAAFKLPNGVWLNPSQPMKNETALEGVTDPKTGKPLSGWSLPIKKEITEYSGTVSVQFFFITPEEGQIYSSSLSSFTVSRGVKYSEPEIPTDPSDEEYTAYRQLLQNLAGLSERGINGMVYELSVAEESGRWETYGTEYKIAVPIEEHKIPHVTNVVALRNEGAGQYYADVLRDYKIYYSGKVAVILDEKINLKIIITGDTKNG